MVAESMGLILIERMGLILVTAFLVMHIPYFRRLLDCKDNCRWSLLFSLGFGVLGVFATYASLVIRNFDLIDMMSLSRLSEADILLPLSFISIVVAGVVGGPVVGAGSAIVTGMHMIWLTSGSVFAWAAFVSYVLLGLVTGLVSFRYPRNQILSLKVSIGVGVTATVLFLITIVVSIRPFTEAFLIVTWIGIPMLLINCIAMMILVMMMKTVIGEPRQEIAMRTGKAFQISEQALGYLKEGLTEKSAQMLAALFLKELCIESAMITNTENVLAYIERGQVGNQESMQEESSKAYQKLLQMPIVVEAMNTSTLKVLKDTQQPIIVIPFNRLRQVAGAIILKCSSIEETQSVELALAEGLGKLISYQLSLLETEKLRVLLKDTELRSLQAQINPHFLFNTLNTIVSLIRTKPDQARFVMVQLSNFMRMNLKLMSSHLVSLEQELCLLESYINIIEVRFAEQLTIELTIDDNLTHYRVPPATIQPLVENCIQHGLKKMTKDGKVVISIHRIEYGVEVRIQDNGSGIPEERLENLAKQQIASKKGNGIGVFNVNERLTALLGEKSQLHIRNRIEGGCEVSFLLPMLEPERSYY